MLLCLEVLIVVDLETIVLDGVLLEVLVLVIVIFETFALVRLVLVLLRVLDSAVVDVCSLLMAIALGLVVLLRRVLLAEIALVVLFKTLCDLLVLASSSD